MKRQIRNNVFETNSSSCHSLAIHKKGTLRPSSLCIADDNKVHTAFGEFGWEVKDYRTQESKLSYLVTMLVETEEKNIISMEDLYETDGFKKINNAIREYCECDGLIIDSNIEREKYAGRFYTTHDGYIDHQSCEDYKNINDFLDYYGTNIIDFIFNDGVVVHTDNDNH